MRTPRIDKIACVRVRVLHVCTLLCVCKADVYKAALG